MGEKRPGDYLIYYDDLVTDTRAVVSRVLEMMGETVDQSFLQVDGRFQRKNIDEYAIADILNTTAECRKALGIPEDLRVLDRLSGRHPKY